MSSASSVSSPLQTERRSHVRRRVDGLAYIDFGPDNGAILIDVGEGGLGFQSVLPVSLGQAVLLKFKLPGETGYIESYAEVVWLNESGKSGGLRFAELSTEAGPQIRAWTDMLSIPDVSAETPQGANGTNTIAVYGAAVENTPAEIIQPSPAPPSEEVAGTLSNPYGSATESHNPEAADGAPAPQIFGQQAAEDPELAALPDSSLAAQESTGQIESTLTAQLERAHVLENDPEAINTAIGPVINSPSKARSVADAPSEGASGRVHSAILAAFTSESSPGAARVSPAAPPRRAPASQASNPGAVQKREQPAMAQPRSPLPAAYRENAPVSASLIRQPQKPAAANPKWDKKPVAEQRAPRTKETLAAQALKIGIAAAAGAMLVLAFIAILPLLRTRVHGTASATSAGTNLLSGEDEFQVEVADLNNRRWILKGGGDAGSPFSNAPSDREAQGTRTSARKEASSVLSRSNDSDNSGNAPDTPRARTARPGELALAHPRPTQAVGAPVQVLAPSIFDGITPPIGSSSDRLPAIGPDAPGPVSPLRATTTTLQPAVLVQRVAPAYPNSALHESVRGEVRVSATIGKDGIPKNLKTVAGDPRLVPAALAAINQWRYRPATLDGEPIETQTTISVSFDLN
jgi:TonB family protein